MDVKLPQLGEGAESGSVASILVKEGDTVVAGQTLMELENEKAVAPIPSPASGRIVSLRVKQGDRVSVGQVLLTLDSGEAPAAPTRPAARQQVPTPPAEPAASPAPVPEPPDAEPAPAASRLGPAAAPSIRRLARDLGIDLARVRGSASGGRIVLADLRAYVQRLQQLAQSPKAAVAPSTQPAAPTERIDFSKWGTVTRQPMSSLRQTISRRMAESWQAVPRVTQFDEADVTRLLELRKKYASAYEQQGTKLTLTSFALKAVVAVLQQHPIFNSSLDEATQEIVFKEYYHLGIAVDTDQGLMAPVIRDVDKKNLLQLSKAVSELAQKARQRKLTLDELKGGTFTISNQGGIGGAHFTPIVNRPEVAILGLGRSVQKPVVKDGQIEARWLLPLAISYDHRVIDGGSAARFCVDLVAALEQFREEDVKL